MPDNPLGSRVALVTGAGRRIGAEIARTLHENGMNVVLHYNTSEAETNSLNQELNQKRKASAAVLQGNLLTPGIEVQLIKKTVEIWDRLDLVVNNASRFYRTAIDKVTEFAWTDLMNSNVKAPFFLTQAAYPHLKKVKGSVVNITDIHGERPMTDYSVYCISKSALLMMTRALARELGPEVRVNAVAPGAIIWPEGENTLSQALKDKIIAETALNREGSAKDIAKAVLFLARDADYVTGQVLNVDGGRSLR